MLMWWTMQVEGGLGWTEDNVFGWHSFLMALAGPVFMSEAILCFTSPLVDPAFFITDRAGQRRFVERLHIVLHVFTMLAGACGIIGICFYKSLSKDGSETNSSLTSYISDGYVFPFFSMYSPHSWAGVATICLWGIQIILRIVSYYVRSLRIAHLHAYVGKVVYVAVLATCAMGLQDMQSSDLGDNDSMGYPPFSSMALVASGMVVVLLVLGAYILSPWAAPKKEPIKSGDVALPNGTELKELQEEPL